MSRLPFIDTYAHFIDPTQPSFTFPGLQPESSHPLIGPDLERLKGRRYLAQDYLAASAESDVELIVHVEAGADPVDPVDETEWVRRSAEEAGAPVAIVAFTNLDSPDASSTLERHLEYGGVRGVRHRSGIDFLASPTFRAGLGLLGRHGLSLDIGSRPPDSMPEVRDLAAASDGVTIALDHCGMVLPRGGARDRAFFEHWRGELRIAAEADNVVCKISGLPLADHDWTVGSLRPWVEAVIEVFGTRRVMFGSHYPYDMLFGSFQRLVDAFRELVSDLSRDEQADLLAGNARRMYSPTP